MVGRLDYGWTLNDVEPAWGRDRISPASDEISIRLNRLKQMNPKYLFRDFGSVKSRDLWQKNTFKVLSLFGCGPY